MAEAGLAGQVSVELRDYRDIDGTFDAICSVEMLEAVGERYWDGYFTALDQHLAPGGRIALQTITMAHDRMLATRHTYTWIHKYIFPGGLLPSVTAIENSLTSATRLRITAREDLGPHYAETLKIWRERFCAHSDEVDRLGFDEVFNRMWTFYLSYSEAGFRAGYIGVSQLTLGRHMIRAARQPGTKAEGVAKTEGIAKTDGVAQVIEALLTEHADLDLPVRLRAWDGSEAGPRGNPGGRDPLSAGAAPHPVASGRAGPGPRLHQRRPRRGGRPHRGPAPGAGRDQGEKRPNDTEPLPGRPAQTVQTALAWTPAALAAARAAARLKVLGRLRRPRPAPRSGSAAACTAGPATRP